MYSSLWRGNREGEKEVLILSSCDLVIDRWECFKTLSGEVLAGHQERFLYQERGQTLEQGSYRNGQCPRPDSGALG